MDEYTRKIRYSNENEQLLKQFQKITNATGLNKAYQRGHVFAFKFTQAQRDDVMALMEKTGLSFEEVFDKYVTEVGP